MKPALSWYFFAFRLDLTKWFLVEFLYGAMVLLLDRGTEMAYFLKKTKNKKGLYLQVYESH